MNCFMFPGQPMTRSDFPSGDRTFDMFASRCCELTGFDPRSDGTAPADMPESVRLQLFGVICSLNRMEALLRQGVRPAILSEHSMGIYAALAGCESISSSAALELTGRIGVCLANMGKRREYALGSVIGLGLAPLEDIAGRNGVHIANHNTSRHFLLAGERLQVESATIEAEAAGAFSVGVFPCDAPLHTPLVEEVVPELKGIVADYSFREPLVPLVDHIEQRLLTAAEVPRFLIEELCCPVYWERTYRTLRSRGVTIFHEVGSGSALTKFNRWIDSVP